MARPIVLGVVGDSGAGKTTLTRGLIRVMPGDIDPAHAAELEEAVSARMSFANHLRVRRLGEFTVGTDLHRSDSLALGRLHGAGVLRRGVCLRPRWFSAAALSAASVVLRRGVVCGRPPLIHLILGAVASRSFRLRK